MLDAAVKALSQILSPPMRSILWRSIGLALVLITVLAIGLQRLLSWFATYGEVWLEGLLGPGFHTSLNVLAWIVSIAAGLGVVFGGGVSDAGDHLAGGERVRRRRRRPCRARALSGRAARHRAAARPRDPEGIKTALLTILVYLVALPFVLFAGAGFLVSSSPPPGCSAANISSSRRCGFARPRKPRRCASDNAATIFTAGLFIAAFVSIPIVNLATPMFGMAFMVHMHKRLSGPRPELIEPRGRCGDGRTLSRLRERVGERVSPQWDHPRGENPHLALRADLSRKRER